MRSRSLAPLILWMVAGCRPQTDAGEIPNHEPAMSTTASPEDPAEPTKAERPAGVIYRSELVRATQAGNAPYLLGQLAPEAYSPQGRFEGWVITRLWPADPELCAPGCDLYVGDIILSVNGSKLETPEQLTNLLADLDALATLDVSGLRDGQFFERSFTILPDPALPE